MEHSEKLDKLAPALSKAQAEMGGAVRDSDNPFFKSKYADLTSVWKACKEALHNNGFSVVQSPVDKDGRIGVSTMLLHDSGQFVSDTFTLGVKKENDPQADGSSITYARRYALAAFVGVCPVDDDAEGAMLRNEPKEKKPKVKLATAEQYKTLKDHYDRLNITDSVQSIFIKWLIGEGGLTEPAADKLIKTIDFYYTAFGKGMAVNDASAFLAWYADNNPPTEKMADELVVNWDQAKADYERELEEGQ